MKRHDLAPFSPFAQTTTAFADGFIGVGEVEFGKVKYQADYAGGGAQGSLRTGDVDIGGTGFPI